MGIQLSPGVRSSEIDISTVVTGTGSTGGVLAGGTTWGPAFVRTLLDNELKQVSIFGKPDNLTANTFFTGADFLQYGNNLNFVRVLSNTARNAAVKGTSLSSVTIISAGAGFSSIPTLSFVGGNGTGAAATAVLTNGVISSIVVSNAGVGYTSNPTVVLTGGSPTTLATLKANVGIVIANVDTYDHAFSDGTSTVGPWASKYAGKLGNNLGVSVADAGNFATWPYAPLFSSAPNTSDSVAALNGVNDEMHVVVIDVTGVISGIPGEVIERYSYVSKASDALTSQGESNYYVNQINRKSNYVSWLSHYVTTNSNWGTASAGANFDLLSNTVVLASSGQTGNFTVGEIVAVYSGSVASIAVTAGTGYTTAPTVAISAPNVTTGVQATAVAVVASGGITGFTITNGGSGYTNIPTVTLTPTNGGTGGAGVVTVSFLTTPLKTAKVANWVSGSRTLTLNLSTKLDFSVNDKVTGLTSTATGFTQSNVAFVNTFSLNGGVDGNDTLTDANIIAGYDLFNVEDFELSLILAADADSTVANYLITNLAETRQDCVVCLSVPKNAVVNNVGNEVTDCVTFRNLLPSSSYAFLDCQWVKKYDKYNDVYRYIPANGDTAGLMVRTDQTRDPWFSPAGLNRGNLKGVQGLAWNPKEAYRDVLYQNGINSIVNFAGQGAVLFGDKTMQTKDSAFSRINVRRLFIYIRQAVAKAAKYVLFEFNDETARGQFNALVDPFLRDVQGRRGLYAYKVVCDASNNDAQVIDTNSFNGDIYLSATRSINNIKLQFVATRTNVNFSEIVGKF